jgi:transposase
MARPQKEPLRSLTEEERAAVEQLSRATSERVDVVARAQALLAVADGARFTAAAHAAGRRSGDAVARLVARFNREGLAALLPRHGGGPPTRYGPPEQERILAEFRRPPDRARDGTATWSLTTLQRALRTAPEGLPEVSTWTIFQALHRAGYSCQNSRTWCETGTVVRKRKAGNVRVSDPETARKRGR